MSFMELDLNIQMSENPLALNKSDAGEDIVVVREESRFKQHTINMLISDRETGSVQLNINGTLLEIPTYKLTITDDKTEEIRVFQVTRDIPHFTEEKQHKSLLSFIGIKRFDTTSYLYENICFEPDKEGITEYTLSKYRKKTEDSLSYTFAYRGQTILLYAGNIENFQKPNDVDYYFVIIDTHNGQSFMGDIHYREQLLKLTPKVQLQLIKRKQLTKEIEYTQKGQIKKKIYL